MEKTLKYGIELAETAGADFAELLVTDARGRELHMENGVPRICTTEEVGLSARVLKAGRWGFACCPFGGKAVLKTLLSAALAAAEYSPAPLRPVTLGHVESVHGQWQSPCQIDPFSLSLKELMDTACEADGAMAIVGIVGRVTKLSFQREDRYYANSQGAGISQTKTLSRGGILAWAVTDGQLIQRSWPGPDGSVAGQGFEYIRQLDLPGNARRLAREVLALGKAPPCPTGVGDVILQGSMLAAQIHYSLAHRTLLGRPGSVPPQQSEDFGLASPLLSIDADAHMLGGGGSYGYDWEGVPAQSFPLVAHGKLVKYFSGRRATAFGRTSTGAMRSSSWQSPPRPFPTNIIVKPGTGSLQDLISGVERGILIDTVSTFVTGPLLQDFVARAEVGWLIELGQVRHLVKSPLYRGYPAAFWSGCDAVAGPQEQQYLGLLDEDIPVGYMIAPMRIRGVKVGASL